MYYKLTVEIFEENPNYAEEFKKFQRGSGITPQAPEKELVKNVLEVRITESQWEEIQKAVIQQFGTENPLNESK